MTKISILPNLFITNSTNEFIPSKLFTLSSKLSHFSLMSFSFFNAEIFLLLFLAAIITVLPCNAKPSAIPKPIPPLPPVTIDILFSRSEFCIFLAPIFLFIIQFF